MGNFENQTEKDVYDLFQDISWAQSFTIDRTSGVIKDNNNEIIYKTNKDFTIIKFRTFDRDTGDVVVRACVETLEFDNDINPQQLLDFWSGGRSGGGYTISYQYPIFQKILLLNHRGINKIKVSKNYKKIRKNNNILLIPFDKYIEVKEKASEIDKQAKSSKDALQRYLMNNAIFDFLNIKIRPTTTINKGDFKFSVDRSNIPGKKDKKDFKDFLNTEDINALGEMFMKMVKKEVFPKNYLKKLDAYFIKEKLEKIIRIGREILSLKSEDVKTEKAEKIAKKIGDGKDISQMETLWQKYFEDYLLYLIFSYRRIVPKVTLKDFDGIDNRPDFVGVNHYGGVDIIEIKTHLKDVLVWDNNHKNFAFSSEMSKAIIQTINYIEAVSREKFKNSRDKKQILESIKEKHNLHHPRGVIVISSKDKIYKGKKDVDMSRLERDFTKLRNSIQNIQVLTFDEILDMSERYSENIVKNYEN